MEVSVQLLDTNTATTVERKAEMEMKVLPGGLEADRRNMDEDAPPGFHEMVGPPGYEDEHGDMWADLHRSPAYTLTA